MIRLSTTRSWTPWRTVVAFGLVSLAADMVYEGMRSISGPYLASLGASALLVGVITGAGEGMALILRLVSGPLADRYGKHWTLTTVGYAMTAICVPLLAIAPALGSAGVAFATTLILLERAGKAIRSPSKSALLADAAKEVGRGKGFAVHKALDQVGSFAGPLVIAAVIALSGRMDLSLAVLAVPGAIAMVLLAQTQRRTTVGAAAPSPATSSSTARLPASFYAFAFSIAANTAGLMTYGVIAFHLVDDDLTSVAMVPVVYSGAMVVAALGALATGFAYDRWHSRVLHLLAPMVALVPVLAFHGRLWVVLLGVALWGAATGIQDSTVKALVADLVPKARLATAYGVFAAFQGVAALAGGALAGGLHQHHLTTLIAVIAALQVVAGVLLAVAVRRPVSARP